MNDCHNQNLSIVSQLCIVCSPVTDCTFIVSHIYWRFLLSIHVPDCPQCTFNGKETTLDDIGLLWWWSMPKQPFVKCACLHCSTCPGIRGLGRQFQGEKGLQVDTLLSGPGPYKKLWKTTQKPWKSFDGLRALRSNNRNSLTDHRDWGPIIGIVSLIGVIEVQYMELY